MSTFDDASLVMIPSGYKASKVYSVKPTDGTGDLTFTRSLGTATRVGADGLIEKVRTNLVLNSAVFVTQTITVTANPHTLSFTGTGTIVITGVGSGTLVGTGVNDRVSLAITTTAGGLILTLTGTATLAQLETGDIATPYIPTTTAAVSVGMLANVPRLDYLGGGCPKLLLEPQRTNLVFFSEQLNNAYWTKTNSTISANVATSPAGFTDADKLVESSDVSPQFHVLTRVSVTISSGVPMTHSVFAKKSERDFIFLFDTQVGVGGYFDLTNGVVGTTTATSSKIEDYGNGWYRCSITYTSVNTIAGLQILPALNGSTLSYIGNGTSGLFVWGAQIEAGAYATSYIPTLGAAVTRSADAASKTGISALIGQTEGTLFVEVNANRTGATQQIELGDGTTANRVNLRLTSTNLFQLVIVQAASVVFNVTSVATFTQGQNLKIAAVYKSGAVTQMFVNGVSVLTGTSGSITGSLSGIFSGSIGGTLDLMNSPVEQILVFKTALSNAQLAELTA